MRTLTVALMLIAGEALGHPGHGLEGPHPHGWDYALLAVAIIAAAFFALRR